MGWKKGTCYILLYLSLRWKFPTTVFGSVFQYEFSLTPGHPSSSLILCESFKLLMNRRLRVWKLLCNRSQIWADNILLDRGGRDEPGQSRPQDQRGESGGGGPVLWLNSNLRTWNKWFRHKRKRFPEIFDWRVCDFYI